MTKTLETQPEEKTVFLCKETNPDFLGREIYADNVETPYNFYLIRKLYLAKEYQNLAEGEQFFEALCESWDESEQFEELIVKKIYVYVETELMYYTVYFGSFEPTTRDLRFALKQWMYEIPTNKNKKTVRMNETNVQVVPQENQLTELAGEIAVLREMLTLLKENLASLNEAVKQTRNPVISRQIKTIHLKRASPVIAAEQASLKISEATNPEQPDATLSPDNLENQEGETTVATSEAVPIKEAQPEKKQENQQSTAAKPLFTFPQETEKSSLNSVNKSAEKEEEQKPEKEAVSMESEKENSSSRTIPADFQRQLDELEEEIYRRFMSRQLEDTDGNQAVPKITIEKRQLEAQMFEAKAFSQSFKQVQKKKAGDVRICNQLSCMKLEKGLDKFLDEVTEYVEKRTLFNKKVRCPLPVIRELEGYGQLNQYMQKILDCY
ncbi:hypothetical protein CVT43_09505 [Enterococcus faecalis OG1RF]|jgi:hypothetical protein|uniref:hypothetical protein n=1 Tax=Enterococcus TaxID=1350 RepID=UPI0002050FE2|nr:hypothetical protein [Enterococcus faecalis]AEA94496.1 hypothetical protein OG1RF_11809 [Enterococcus faecalis OG1RF]AZV34551.1 hypothetical protein CVT43_09505 [Enterococcus faecalis OG1RF]AZV97395.1 hypothetical protein CVT44_09505 [Enterococcus faecalis]EIB6529888.1 hypothetical protein [Enterococcus faecalis]EIQ7125352.1 hypothetical protein [Enterococcus faecalis]